MALFCVTSHRFTSFFFRSEMNGKLSETRRAKLMDLKKREAGNGGTESECGTCRHEVVLDRRWTGVENHPETRKQTSINLDIPGSPLHSVAYFSFSLIIFCIFDGIEIVALMSFNSVSSVKLSMFWRGLEGSADREVQASLRTWRMQGRLSMTV